MPDLIVTDAEDLELTLVSAIKDTFLSVPAIAQYVKVWPRDRFPDNELSEINVSTVPDLVTPDVPMTSIIQIGIPTVNELEYTADTMTKLIFLYPITFDLSVKDSWANQLGTVPFPDSRRMAMAIYLRARKAFKDNRTFGYGNVVHEFLQQDGQTTVEDEDTGAKIHALDWSIRVFVKGTRA